MCVCCVCTHARVNGSGSVLSKESSHTGTESFLFSSSKALPSPRDPQGAGSSPGGEVVLTRWLMRDREGDLPLKQDKHHAFI